MPKMGTDDGRGQEKQQEIIETDSEPLRGRSSQRSVCFNPLNCTIATPTVDDEAYVEVTLDLGDDSVAVKSVSPAGRWDTEDPALTLIARTLVRGSSSLGSSLARTASNSIKKVSQELQNVTSLSRRPAGYRRINRNKSASAYAFNGLKFISNAHGAKGWPAVEKRFDEFAVDGFLPRSRFGQCIGTKESTEFDIELFDALARRRNITRYSINKAELKDFWDQISDQSFDSRLQTFFDMVDKNADGRINEEEVRKIISLSASDNKLNNIQERAEEYARLIMEEFDPNNEGYIKIDSLEMLLLQAPSESVRPRDSYSQYRSRLLSQMLKPTPEPNPLQRWYKKAWYFIEDQWKRVWVVALWLCVCAGLFTWKFMQYRHRAVYHVMGYCVCIAKGGAETLKLNMALILLPVCRNTITWIRYKTKLGAIVPLDDNLNFHMVIACGIVVGVGLHAISHLTCDFPRLLHASEQAYIPMKPFFGNARPNDYWWFVKGTDGWTGILMVLLMALAFTLALPCFRRHEPKKPKNQIQTTNQRPKLLDTIIGYNSFWYTHHLFVVVYVLLINHSIFIYLSNEWYEKTTWMYLAIPMVLYACERLTRTVRSSNRPVKVLKVAVYPGDVLALQVTKPKGFKYRSGQYMFVRCSEISPIEWHPFSITSAPQDDYLSVHIRAVGDWTRQIKAIFSKVCNRNIGSSSLRTDNDYSGNNPYSSLPRVKIDGPYGAPAQDYQKYEVVLLVGLGIGATPFISIVKDILNNLEQLEAEGLLKRDLEGGGGGDGSSHRRGGRASFKTRQAYLYWMTREQGSFEWFRGMMNEVAERDKKGAIELHNHCTSMFEERDARSALITMLQWLNHAKNGVDVVAGTRVKTHFGRPDWRSVYKRIAQKHPDQRIGVFYCGMPTPVKELRKLALEFSRNTNTKFDFHKENF